MTTLLAEVRDRLIAQERKDAITYELGRVAGYVRKPRRQAVAWLFSWLF